MRLLTRKVRFIAPSAKLHFSFISPVIRALWLGLVCEMWGFAEGVQLLQVSTMVNPISNAYENQLDKSN
jgi:hypothetical protein